MRRLYARIYVYMLMVILIVGIAGITIFSSSWKGYVTRQELRTARLCATLLAEHFDDPAARSRLVRQLATEFNRNITVRDLTGRVLVVEGRELPLPRRFPIRDSSSFFTTRTKGSDEGWGVTTPVIDESTGAILGMVASSPQTRVRRSLAMSTEKMALLLLVIGGASFFLARRISGPVEKLTQATQKLALGDLGYRIPLKAAPNARLDELGALIRSWNEMAERIEGLVRGHRELLANVSHELRSPLARIRLALELLPQDARTEARFRDVISDFEDLDRLIDDVLTTSRLEAIALPLRLQPVDAGDLLVQVADRAAQDPSLVGKEVRVATHPTIAFAADGALLRRALWNLVENAAKYGAPPIVLDAELRSGAVVFTVTDEGPGIHPADRERVFTPFYRRVSSPERARSQEEPPRGFGLGLTLARRIAELHGGTIRVEPAHWQGSHEQGCRMVVTLPIAASQTAA